MTSHDECTKECAKTATPKSGWLEQVVDASDARPFHFPRPYKKEGKGSGPPDYISSGYTNWKDACAKFPNHESSRYHKDAVLKTITLPATAKDIGESLSSQLAKDRLERRQCFLKLLSNVRFLARQVLPLRGGGDESNSNYMQLLFQGISMDKKENR